MKMINYDKNIQNKIDQIIDVQLHKNKYMNQFHIHDLYNLFCSKGPNNLYLIFKKKSCVITFDFYVHPILTLYHGNT
jgi:hypothetical protein